MNRGWVNRLTVDQAAALAVARHVSDQRERVAIESATNKLLAASVGLPLYRLTAIMEEVSHRHRLFERLAIVTAGTWVGSPERRAVESVYADVISGRL